MGLQWADSTGHWRASIRWRESPRAGEHRIVDAAGETLGICAVERVGNPTPFSGGCRGCGSERFGDGVHGDPAAMEQVLREHAEGGAAMAPGADARDRDPPAPRDTPDDRDIPDCRDTPDPRNNGEMTPPRSGVDPL
jgi:hypothetical protein